MNGSYFDSHAHVSGMAFPEIVLQNAKNLGNFAIMNICLDENTLKKGLELAEQHDFFFNAGATVPNDVGETSETVIPLFARAAKEKKLHAIGETGLDYFHHHSTKERQKFFLQRYLEIAWDLSLPLIFHCREAFSDLFSFCDEHYGSKGNFPAILHCFTGSIQEAEEVIKRGWYLSCSGIVTYKKSKELREVIKEVPLEKLLVETDCPYLAPQSKRGKQNEPAYLLETIEKVAEIKQEDPQTIANATFGNALKAFSIQLDEVGDFSK